jgi:sporulation protein YlmC with PRC-barrel domain
MGIATHLGPWLLGTVKDTTGTATGTVRNVGATTVSQSYTAPSTVILTSPTAQLMFALPAGSKIIRFNVEVVTALTTATNCGLVIGDSGTSNKYVTTFNTGATVGKVAQATIDTATQVAQTNNIGTSDVNIYGTFTAATGNAAAGAIVVTVEYIVRNADGTYTNTP